ncbi:MAG: NADH:ubiquinone reductase (Na(+)-transporting) subunit C [Saprospiraceae bacterium]|nr:NADH:ubiquinone reductase (Na(+)-transporting) subunit C [Saprospiraceae bacterium]
MENNRYVIIFILVLTCTVAVLLTFIREATKDQAALNEDIFNKRSILSAIEVNLDKKVSEFSDEEVVNIFNDKFEQVVLDANGQVIEGVKAENIDMAKEKKKPEAERSLPLYIYRNGENVNYILSVRGNGLWDEIWGNIALGEDLNTVVGAAFDHKGETPGLGAEIKDNPTFSRNFQGKEILASDGDFVSILVKKGGAEPGNVHQVDGISGATITSNGVTDMLYNGIKSYQPYLETLRGKAQQGMLQQQ